MGGRGCTYRHRKGGGKTGEGNMVEIKKKRKPSRKEIVRRGKNGGEENCDDGQQNLTSAAEGEEDEGRDV